MQRGKEFLFTKIGIPYPAVVQQLWAAATERDATAFKDIASRGKPEGSPRVLLHQDHRDATGCQPRDDFNAARLREWHGRERR